MRIKTSGIRAFAIKRRVAIIVFFLSIFGNYASAASSNGMNQNQYAYELLHQALENTSYNEKPRVSPSNDATLADDGKDVIWTAANDIAYDSPHHVVEIPVFRGLLSYYSVIYHKASVPGLAKTGFKGNEIGMLQHDAMAEPLQKQGIKIVKTRAVGSLVQMLNKARFEAMLTPTVEVEGLSVTEAYETPQQIAMLHNPWYFVVHKDRPELARALELGLHRMLKNGSLDELLEKTPWMTAVKKHLTEHQSVVLNLALANQYKPAPVEAEGFWVIPQEPQAAGSEWVSAAF